MYQFGELSQETLEQLSGSGVFFTVKNGDKVNSMTIGWGSLSQYWGQEIFIAPIRFSRYTFEMLKNTDEFTISVPTNKQLDEALKICGTVSGRDGDKLKKANISAKEAKTMKTPVIDGCDIYYECKILGYSDLKAEELDESVVSRSYTNGDMHRLFFAKIVAAYRK